MATINKFAQLLNYYRRQILGAKSTSGHLPYDLEHMRLELAQAAILSDLRERGAQISTLCQEQADAIEAYFLANGSERTKTSIKKRMEIKQKIKEGGYDAVTEDEMEFLHTAGRRVKVPCQTHQELTQALRPPSK